MTSYKRHTESSNTTHLKKRRILRFTSNEEYIELYDGKMVDLLLKLSQSNHPNAPDWLNDPRNKYRIQLQLEFFGIIGKQTDERAVYKQKTDDLSSWRLWVGCGENPG